MPRREPEPGRGWGGGSLRARRTGRGSWGRPELSTPAALGVHGGCIGRQGPKKGKGWEN